MKITNALAGMMAMVILSSCSSSLPESPEQEVRKQKMDKISSQGLGFRTSAAANSVILQGRRRGVVKILIPTGPLHAVKELIPENSFDLQKVYTNLKAQKDHSHSTSQDLLALQIYRCLQHSKIECLVRSDFHTHTGFFVNNGKMLITSSRLADEESFDPETSDFLVYDEDGSLRIDETNGLRFEANQESPAATRLSTLMGGISVGFLTFVSEKTTGASLALTPPRQLTAEHDYSILGYPGKTLDRDTGTNSDGQQQYYAMGEWLPLATAFAKLGISLNDLDANSLSEVNSNLFSLRADSDLQMLGSPVLNWQGDVIGVVVATSPTLTNKFTLGQRLWQRY